MLEPDYPLSLREERALARARLALTAASLFVVYLDPSEPVRSVPLTYILLSTYVLWSGAIAFVVETRQRLGGLPTLMHLADILWIAAVTFVSGGSSTPLFAFQMFALVAAAYRWGGEETLATAILLGAVLFAQTALLRPAVSNAFELNRFVVRAAYTMVVGVLLALLAAYARQLRLQSSLVARVLTDLRSETSFTHALDRCVREIRTLFGARGAIVAIRHHSSGRTFVWTFSSAQDDELVPDVIADGEPNRYFFACPAAFTLGRRGNTSTARAVLDGARAKPSVLAASPAPDSARALVVCEPATEEWEARIFVLDPQAGARGARALRQLRELTRTFLPALYGVYLVSEVRERAETDERARLARDLHDTSIQSLIGLEMELRALERHTADATLRGQLVTLEGRLREEIRVLRALMAKRSDSRPSTGAITEQISEELARFQIETRIRARLVSSMAVVLPPRTGLTILRLVQAALSNVRRHSTASRVDVSIERDADGWLVVIADDGMFDERLQTTAPRTMQERVSALGGQLVVKRGEPTGVRVEIRLPLHMSS